MSPVAAADRDMGDDEVTVSHAPGARVVPDTHAVRTLLARDGPQLAGCLVFGMVTVNELGGVSH